jgi:hypothetical protein
VSNSHCRCDEKRAVAAQPALLIRPPSHLHERPLYRVERGCSYFEVYYATGNRAFFLERDASFRACGAVAQDRHEETQDRAKPSITSFGNYRYIAIDNAALLRAATDCAVVGVTEQVDEQIILRRNQKGKTDRINTPFLRGI